LSKPPKQFRTHAELVFKQTHHYSQQTKAKIAAGLIDRASGMISTRVLKFHNRHNNLT